MNGKIDKIGSTSVEIYISTQLYRVNKWRNKIYIYVFRRELEVVKLLFSHNCIGLKIT